MGGYESSIVRTGLLLSCSNTIELWGQSGIVFIHSKTNMHFIQWDAHWSSLKFKIPSSTQRLYCLHYFKMRGLKDWVTRPIKQHVGLVSFGNTVLPCRSTDTTLSFFPPLVWINDSTINPVYVVNTALSGSQYVNMADLWMVRKTVSPDVPGNMLLPRCRPG